LYIGNLNGGATQITRVLKSHLSVVLGIKKYATIYLKRQSTIFPYSLHAFRHRKRLLKAILKPK